MAVGALLLPGSALAARYVGPVDQPVAQTFPPVDPPTVEFKTERDPYGRHGKMVQVVFPFVTRNLWYACSDGKRYYPGADPASETRSREDFGISIRINKKHGFSDTFRDYESGEGMGMTVAGRISRNGKSASGTVRLFAHWNAVDDPLDPPPQPAKDCDSGVLHWTAKRVKK